MQRSFHITVFLSWFHIQLVGCCWTYYAVTRFDASHNNLLWVVANKECKQWVTTANDPISTHYGHAVEPNSLQWIQDSRQTAVIKVGDSPVLGGFVANMFQLRRWQVTKKNVAVTRCLSTSCFGNIADGKIDCIRQFVAKQGDLCFIRRYYDRNNSHTRLS